MNEGQATFWMSILFALRCFVPILITLIVGYLMNKLVDKWEAEEIAEKAQSALNNHHSSSNVVQRFKPLAAQCWTFNKCKESDCPAYKNVYVPCWRAKLKVLGYVPDKCEACPLYERVVTAV